MLSLWKKYFLSFIFDTEENDEDDSPEILKFLNDNEDPGCGKLLSASGTVTYFTRDYGLIDARYSFPISLTSNDLKVGAYLIYPVCVKQLGICLPS